MPNLNKVFNRYQKKITSAENSRQLEKVRIEVLGRKGKINQLFSKIKTKPQEEKQSFGKELNRIKGKFENLIKSQSAKILPKKRAGKRIEKTTVGLEKIGHLHPITITENEINSLFRSMGFSIYDGPEIETDEYCFERLNVPKTHPARDLQDTIYIEEPEILLRTQTSSVEARLLEKEKPPFKAAFPGRVYRNEKVNKSNHFIFHHYQGVAVDRNISLKDLIGVFQKLFRQIYGTKVKARYRCKYYPEVEPGLGLDLQCFQCHGKGCQLCKGGGWIEMGGAGIIHPYVMEASGIDPKKWRGFAFGLGLDRWVMAKYKISDIRTLLGGNLAYKPNR
ncbi:MAG: phenylalanine--tRNA ligase subunit alpha [Patescibacteria group bacterium]|nr:phenylalanine--tRNA ligase subunit alpha [Patescibacteria group bacterium]